MKLTARNSAALKLPASKSDHIAFDDDVPGFGLRIRETGSRTWIFQYKLGSKQRRLVLGRASALPADKARGLAADLHAKVRLGGDPAADKAASKANAALSFRSIADRFLAWQKKRLRPRSYVEVERHVLKHAKQLHGMPIATIDQQTIAVRIGTVADTKGAPTANLVRRSLSALFSWAMKEGLVSQNPVTHTNAPPKGARDRVLSDSELVTIWRACGDDDYGDIVRLLLLTGQRRNEISCLRWSEVDFDKKMIELPAARVKNARAHRVPMSDAVCRILQRRRRIEGRDFVFGRRDGPFANMAWGKTQIDERTGGLPHWTLHDLRRTCATRMADLGVQPHIIEAVLNHVSGHKGGIAGIYNRATYAAEKAQALALWADHVIALVG
jgi:integrase